MKTINIAFAGPAGEGKRSNEKEVAKELGYIYVDTGALYRTVALYASDFSSRTEFLENLDDCHVELKYLGGVQCVFLDGDDVTDKIRTPEITMKASEISAIPEVRAFLLEKQREIARDNNVIMDGRDIGTVVLPDADLKVFLTASAEERASRRYLELKGKPDAPSYAQILEDIQQRDNQDSSRKIAPLKQAKDAVLLDTTNMGFHEVCEALEDLIEKKLD